MLGTAEDLPPLPVIALALAPQLPAIPGPCLPEPTG